MKVIAAYCTFAKRNKYAVANPVEGFPPYFGQKKKK